MDLSGALVAFNMFFAWLKNFTIMDELSAAAVCLKLKACFVVALGWGRFGGRDIYGGRERGVSKHVL